MSWSISASGNAEEVAEKLERNGETITDEASKAEYEAAKPYLIGLVRQNYNSNGSKSISLYATGSGWAGGRNCTVSIQA